MKRIFFIFVLSIFGSLATQAQEPAPSKDADFEKEIIAIHPKIGLGINAQLADFEQFEGLTNCGAYGPETGLGFNYIFALERLVFKNTFLSLGASYHSNNCKSFAVPLEAPVRNFLTGGITRTTTEVRLETEMSIFEFQPDFRYILSADAIGGGPLRLVAGARFAFPMSASYYQYEEIVEPDYARFTSPDTVLSRDLAEGDITTMNSFSAGLAFGIDNLIRLKRGHAVSQELIFNYNFSDWTTDADWGFFAVRLNVGYRLGLYSDDQEDPKEIEDIPPVEEVPIVTQDDIPELPVAKNPELTVELFVQDQALHKVYGEELLASVPVVNAVFFEKNSAEIPSEYRTDMPKETNFFRIESVYAHDFLIPRIASILEENPEATIKLIGTSSGNDEESNSELARKRAEVVRDAFLNCGVPKEKINVSTTPVPGIESNTDFEDGRKENRRTEIIVSDAPLMEYVDFQNFSEIKGKVVMRVDARNMSPSDIITVENNKTKGSFSFALSQLDENNEIELPVSFRLDPSVETVDFRVTATGKEVTDKASLNIPVLRLSDYSIDKDYSKFRAILRFDYDKDRLSDENRALLKQLGEILPENSVITIAGSADDLGSGERNKQLTRLRAEKAKQYLQSYFKGKFTYETGKSTEKVDESTPQGRFINRCIIIRVRVDQ